ncbi:hypothetical protein Poli38472_000476 [Pythium oligandrum]|uniref:Uncharacterized protein n=1 Tax=Pythium oligandrum TaxID=41045 RepID=A0A8K1FGW8_PYTOL|nr:hypothetical protein Poli38472_000476 [Pythium oligandrum]|eukprot:TMW60434.1 hypothetical protein Poli38472_000476 [Pythium oligandrum]
MYAQLAALTDKVEAIERRMSSIPTQAEPSQEEASSSPPVPDYDNTAMDDDMFESPLSGSDLITDTQESEQTTEQPTNPPKRIRRNRMRATRS